LSPNDTKLIPMSRRAAGISFLLLTLASSTALGSDAPALNDVETCLGETTRTAECIKAAWSDRDLALADLEVIESLKASDPEAAESVAAWAKSRIIPSDPAAAIADPSLAARLLELHAEALSALGRLPEAVEELAAAIAIDDGTAKLTWMTPDGSAWQVPIGTGDGRLVRGARTALEANRVDEARAWLALALRSGAEGWAEQAWEKLGEGPPAGLDPAPSDLEAPSWFPPLPDLEIPLIGGGSLDLKATRGKILLLDFWASWCAPCLDELPQLQVLWEREKERGLVAVAINAQEPDELATRTAASLGLTLPIGRYTHTAHRELRVNALPTVILADRSGRVRDRWNGYSTGLELAIADRVRSLLDESSSEDMLTVARVLSGEGRLQVRWSRELTARPGGLGVVAASDGALRIAVSEPGRVSGIGVDGRTLGKFTVPPETGRLVQGDFDGNGRPELVGFRSGGERVVLIDAAAGRHRLIDAPATVMDAAVIQGTGEGARSRLALATLDGLYLIDVDGDAPTRVGSEGRRTGVAAPRGGGVVALDRERSVAWYDGEGTVTGRSRGPADGWTLVADAESDGVGVLPAGDVSAATGSFTGTGRREVAVAGPSDQLVVVDIETGQTVFRARWPAVVAVAAQDLDGDGHDELLVASGRALTVLERVPQVK
jgi:cytochrome c biogenesis protein CcmG/thiol:disulfide interchange protein DsbE